MGLVDPARAWPQLTGELVGAAIGELVEVEVRPFHPTGRDPAPYLRRLLDEVEPDVVVFQFGTTDFAVTTVTERVSRRYGARAARLLRRMETRFAKPRTEGAPGTAERVVRRVSRRVIGADPVISRDAVGWTLREAFRVFGQREDVVAVVCPAPLAGRAMEESPGSREIRAAFNAEMRAVVEGWHFEWVEVETPESEFFKDGFHLTQAGQERQASAMAEGVVRVLNGGVAATSGAIQDARATNTRGADRG